MFCVLGAFQHISLIKSERFSIYPASFRNRWNKWPRRLTLQLSRIILLLPSLPNERYSPDRYLIVYQHMAAKHTIISVIYLVFPPSVFSTATSTAYALLWWLAIFISTLDIYTSLLFSSFISCPYFPNHPYSLPFLLKT